jgi:hypothetical protein
MLLNQFKRKGIEKGFFFFEVENCLRKVETDSGNFDLKWPLAFWRFFERESRILRDTYQKKKKNPENYKI